MTRLGERRWLYLSIYELRFLSGEYVGTVIIRRNCRESAVETSVRSCGPQTSRRLCDIEDRVPHGAGGGR